MIAQWAFAVPDWWPALLLLPVVAVLGWWRQRRRAAQVRDVLGPREPEFAGRPCWRGARRTAALLALLGCGIAWLQPHAGVRDRGAAGPDCAFALDVSWSMAAQDLRPSRFDRAVADLAALAEHGRGARGALLAFAGSTRLCVPLTADLEALALVAERLAPGAELRGGTDLGGAIAAAAAALRRAGSTAGSIVVLTDGEDFAGSGRAAAAAAREQGFAVSCVGYGTEVGSKIAVEVEGGGGQTYLRDETGAEVVTALDPDALAALAAAGGGEFVLAGEAAVLNGLYDRALAPRARLAAAAGPDRELAHRYQWPLLAALLLWMLRLLMPERSR